MYGTGRRKKMRERLSHVNVKCHGATSVWTFHAGRRRGGVVPVILYHGRREGIGRPPCPWPWARVGVRGPRVSRHTSHPPVVGSRAQATRSLSELEPDVWPPDGCDVAKPTGILQGGKAS